MNIKKQRNIYFLDPVSNIYKGYIETYITNLSDLLIKYKFSDLDITSVSVYRNGKVVTDAIFTMELLKDKIEDKKLFKTTNCNYLNIKMSEVDENEEIKIKIDFTSSDSNNRILYYKPLTKEDKHKEVISINKNNDSSGIFPSIDTSLSYEWELIYIYSSFEELVVISPGVLKSFVEEGELVISSYKIKNSPSGVINFALGSYKRFEIINGDDKKFLFCPLFMDYLKDAVLEIIEDFVNIIKYVEFFIQMSYPLDSLNVLFTLLDIDKISSLSNEIYNISYISTFNDIEPKFLIKRTISEILTTQIFYYHVYAKDPTDFWIFCGFKGYLEDYCVRLLLGNNEFLYQYKKDKDYVLANDVYELPLCHEKRDVTSYNTEFYKKKCKLIFHTLENNLSKAFLEKICRLLLEKKQQITDNFTADFLLLIKDITGKDMKHFFEFYVFNSGLVRVKFKFSIDPKKNKVDYTTTQEPTSKLINKNTTVLGSLTLMSYEVEGSFEHSLNLSQPSHFYYHIRTKKRKKVEEDEDEVMPLLWMRLDPKREQLIDGIIEQPDFMFIEQALDKNVIGQLEALKELSKNPSIQICEVFERLLENSHVFYKVRIYVMYCIVRINIEKFIGFQRLIQFYTKKYFVQSSTIVKPNEFMFINYFLQKHCVRALSMTDPFIVRNYNNRNVVSSNVICSFIINILKFNDNSSNTYNDSWYIASVIENLSRPLLSLQFRDTSKKTNYNLNVIDDVILENDVKINKEDFDLEENSSDDFREIFREKIPDNFIEVESVEDTDKSKFINEALEEVERYRIMDMIFPSHKNIITEASIYLFGRLSIYGCLGFKKESLVDFSKFPNSFKVRKAALLILILLYTSDPSIVKYLFDVVKTEILEIKYIILDGWINLLEIQTQSTKTELLPFKTDIFNLVKICQYDYDFKSKIYEIIDFLDNKDLSPDEYNFKMVEYCNSNYSKEFINNKTNNQLVLDFINRIRLKNFIEMRKQYLKETYILKFKIPGKKEESPIKEINQKKSVIMDTTKMPINEVKFESKLTPVNKKEVDLHKQKNTKLEDANLQEMLKFEELENTLGDQYKNIIVNTNTVISSSNEFSSYNLTSFSKLVNFENDKFELGSIKPTNSNINKLINDFRMQVSENSKKSDSCSISGGFDFFKPNFSETLEDLSKSEINFTPETIKKLDIEKFLSDDESDKETNLSCKTQVLEERDFDKRFDKIDFEPSRNNDLSFRSVIVENTSNITSVLKKQDSISSVQSHEELYSFNGTNSFLPTKNVSSVVSFDNNRHFTSHTPIPYNNNANLSNTERSNIIETFLDSDEVEIIQPSIVKLEKGAYRINEVIIRFLIYYKIRIPVAINYDYNKKIRKRSMDEISSPEFNSSKRIAYQIRSNDLITKKLFYGTINNMSIKQVNKVIFKNKNNSFFDWRPKTFKEIEIYVDNENKYRKVCKEMERSLVFALSYSQFGSRTFNITKRLFEIFESKIYETYMFPKYIHPMSELLRNYCVDYLNRICLNEKFIVFIRPVNIEGLEAYIDIVRSPMCLDIVQKKMMKYSTLEAFYGDIKQIIKNCCYFNQNDSEIVQSAKRLLKTTQEYDKYLTNIKTQVKSEEMIRLLLQRFEDSVNLTEILRNFETRQIVTFRDLISEVRNIKSTGMRKFISQQELHNEIGIFEDQIFYAFNVYNEKVYSWDIY